LGIGPEVIHVTFLQRLCVHFVCALRCCEKLNLKAKELVDVAEEISRQSIILGVFIQVYNENWEPKSRQKDLKNFQLVQKSQYKDGAKEGLVSEEISAIKKKPTTLHQ
jgi:hypothetical protein